jgi:hypothetical protein
MAAFLFMQEAEELEADIIDDEIYNRDTLVHGEVLVALARD